VDVDGDLRAESSSGERDRFQDREERAGGGFVPWIENTTR
jgi:hypothetical protein